MIGQKFGRLTVIGEASPRKKYRRWKVKCVCGVEKIVDQANLRKGHTKSCGCLNREMACKMGSKNITHGLCNNSEYNSWKSMKQRCFYKKGKAYKNYGGRGITVCKRWLNFENFIKDMGKKPSSKHSINRIDNDGNYEPKNCKWSTSKEQNKNRRKFLTGQA